MHRGLVRLTVVIWLFPLLTISPALGQWSIETVADGRAPSIAIPSSGQPQVAYRGSDGAVMWAVRTPTGWEPERVSPDGWGAASGPHLRIDSDGTPHIGVTAQDNAIAHCAIQYSERVDGTWSHSLMGIVEYVRQTHDCWYESGYGSCAFDLARPYTAHLVYFYYDWWDCSDGGGSENGYRYQTYDGSTWTSSSLDKPRVATLAVDGAGRPHVTSLDDGGTLEVWLLNDAGEWVREATLGSNVLSGAERCLCVDRGEGLHATWENNASQIVYAREDGGWIPEVITEGAVGSLGLCIDSHGSTHVAFTTAETPGRLRYGRRLPDGWEVFPSIPVGTADPSEVSLAVDPDGGVHLAFFDRAASDIIFAYTPTTIPRLTAIVPDSGDTVGVAWEGIEAPLTIQRASSPEGPWESVAIVEAGVEAVAAIPTEGSACFYRLATEEPAAPTADPVPASESTGVPDDTVLSWTAAEGAESYDVYLGTELEPGPGEFLGNTAATFFDPGGLEPGTTYFWRVDARNLGGITTGAVWRFETLPDDPDWDVQLIGPANVAQYSLALDAQGRPHVSYVGADGSLVYTGHDGTSWPTTTVDTGAEASSIAMASTDAPRIAYVKDDSLYYTGLDDPSADWWNAVAVPGEYYTEPDVVRDYDVVGTVSLTFDSAGIPYVVHGVSWYHRYPSGHSSVYYESSGVDYATKEGEWWTPGADASWLYGENPWKIAHVSESTCRPEAYIAADDTGRAHVVHEAPCGTGVIYASLASIDDHWEGETIDSAGSKPGLALDSAGVPHAVYSTAGGIYYARRGTGGWEIELLDADAGDASIAVDDMDRPHVACRAGTGGDLRYSTDSGSGWETEAVPGLEVTGATRIAVDAGATPHILVRTAAGLAHVTRPGAFRNRCTAPSPGNTTVGQPVDIALAWTGVEAATGYDVYFGTTPNPGAAQFMATQPETTFDPGLLDYDTTYYWRIDAVVDDVRTTGYVWWFRTLEPPAAAANPAPAVGAEEVSVDTVATWSSVDGADSYDVYFGTNSLPGTAEFRGSQTGTTFDPGTLAYATDYFWRIDTRNAAGGTSGDLWWFQTTAKLPARATNPHPADGALSLSHSVVLSWAVSVHADSYDVYFGTNPIPDAAEFRGNQAGTTFDPGALEYATDYYWSIDSRNTQGTAVGDVWRFRTLDPPPQAADPSPGDGGSAVPSHASLSWDAVAEADSYDVYFGTNPIPDAAEFRGNQAGTTFDPGALEYATDYYWRIDPRNAAGVTTGGVWQFRTLTAPSRATDPVPGDLAVQVPIDSHVSWTSAVHADSYDVYFGTNPIPDAAEFRGNQAGTTFDPGTLAYATDYYWRIDPRNAAGVTAGEVWRFQTLAPPRPSGNPFPGNGADDVPLDWILSWSSVPEADSYDVYFGTNAIPDATEFIGNQAGTTFDPGGLSYATDYYWRVDPRNAAGVTAGEVWTFRTRGLPSPPIDPYPVNGSASVPPSVVLSWSGSVDTESYDVYFGTNALPDAAEFRGNQVGTTFDPGLLGCSTMYYWRIDPRNERGVRTGSVWSFRTDNPTGGPAKAGSPSPENGAVGVAAAAGLSWEPAVNAQFYDVYFGSGPTVGAGDYRGRQGGTSFDPGPLDPDRAYFWRIDVENVYGGVTGDMWQFRTTRPAGEIVFDGGFGDAGPFVWTHVFRAAGSGYFGSTEAGGGVDGEAAVLAWYSPADNGSQAFLQTVTVPDGVTAVDVSWVWQTFPENGAGGENGFYEVLFLPEEGTDWDAPASEHVLARESYGLGGMDPLPHGAWQTGSATAVAVTPGAQYTIGLRVGGDPANGNQAWFDNVSVSTR